MFRFLVYCTTSIALFWSLKQSNFLHKGLTGTEDRINVFQNYPCQSVPNFLDDIYVIKLAYHCYEMVLNVCFHRDRRDFSEFLLHHILTIALVLFSYIVNFLPIGAIIMLLMDFSDIFVAVFKMAVDVNEVFQTINFFIMLFTWIYIRIWHFPIYVLYPFIVDLYTIKHPV